jgi:hypothetical protein
LVEFSFLISQAHKSAVGGTSLDAHVMGYEAINMMRNTTGNIAYEFIILYR